MKHLFLFFLLIITSVMVYSQNPVSITLEAGAKSYFGHTTYDMNERDVNIGIFSQLKFPLSSIMPGLSAEILLTLPSMPEIYIKPSCYINVTNPYLPMIDKDWVQFGYYPKLMFSYTESREEMFFLLAELLFSSNLLKKDYDFLFFNAGYRFEYINQHAIGFKGWQTDIRDGGTYDTGFFDVPDEGIIYDIYYHSLILGLGLKYKKPVSWNIDANYMLLWIADIDDHVLRNKLSEASGIGHGFDSSVGVKLYLGGKNSKSNPYIKLAGNFKFMAADLEQTQTYYGDDLGFPGDQTGEVSEKIDHQITSLQYDLAIVFGFEIGN
ncbi:MAG: hypothetical protein JXR70_11485 [Spirochaetales bacterium]|nr:hypothetical protein [Spirochaetales bacterium]